MMKFKINLKQKWITSEKRYVKYDNYNALSLSLSLSQVSDYKQKEVMTNNALTELSTKVELLTSALDKETETRQSLEEQVHSYRTYCLY